MVKYHIPLNKYYEKHKLLGLIQIGTNIALN